MLINDINKLPQLGQFVTMVNSVTGETERLKAVHFLHDDVIENTIHVFFASNNPKENPLVENGIPYCCIRTYAPYNPNNDHVRYA